MPIPSLPPSDARRTALLSRAAGAALLALAGPAAAHDLGGEVLPETTGWRVGAAAALAAVSADQAWPVARWPGQPGTGQTPADRRGLALEHATLDLAATLDRAGDHGAYLALGRHGSDRAHTEAAWWRSRIALGEQRLAVQLGRDRLPLGEPLRSSGHVDRYAQVPLIKRVVLGDDLLADGINLQWQPAPGGVLRAVDLGLWRVRSFPGAAGGPAAPALHLQAGQGELRGDVVVAQLQPRGRATVAAGSAAGHSHQQPDCRLSLTALACFDGDTRLAGASLSWEAPRSHARLSLAALVQDDRGELYSSRGAARYRGRVNGGWVDLALPLGSATGQPWAAGWQAGLRLERSVARHDLVGLNASLVADDAGLNGHHAIHRAAGMLGRDLTPDLTLSGELGTERGGAGSATVSNRWAGLRLVWRSAQLLSSR